MLRTQPSIIDAFLALFKLLPTEAQKEIKQELAIDNTRIHSVSSKKLQLKGKLSSLEGKVSKMSTVEIDKQIKQLRSEWERDI